MVQRCIVSRQASVDRIAARARRSGVAIAEGRTIGSCRQRRGAWRGGATEKLDILDVGIDGLIPSYDTTRRTGSERRITRSRCRIVKIDGERLVVVLNIHQD